MSPFQVLLALHVLSLSISTLTCLPITSKPIENTPEHLAWEAWIMVPPTEEKTRKITPKSIFILPNKTNGGAYSGVSNTQHIQCPPGHRVDNLRCIPTVNIDRDQILIDQLTNLLHSTDKDNQKNGNNNESSYSYDYDYDYGDGYDPDNSESLPQTGNVPPDYNGEPLKINLSLGKFPANRDDSKDIGNFGSMGGVDETYDDLKVQPFRGQEKTSTTTYKPTPSTKKSTTQQSSNTTTQSSTITPNTTKQPEKRGQATVPDLDFSKSSHISTVYTTTVAPNDTTIPILILSPSESEISSIKPSNINDTDSDFDYNFAEQTTIRTTNLDDDEMDIVTEIDETQTNLKEELIDESLVFDKFQTENFTEPEESTEINLITTTMTQANKEDNTSQTEIIKDLRSSTKKLEEQSLPPKQNDTIDKDENRTNSGLKMSDKKRGSAIDSKPDNNKKMQQAIRLQDESEPLLDSIESNNRFVYHHLGSSFRRRPDNIESTTPNIQEQLRIINRIVEENKRREQHHARIRFPSESEEQERQGNFRDFIRFPDSVTSYVPSPPSPPYGFRSEHSPIYNKFSERIQQPMIITPTSPTDTQKTVKPYWWLPSGWEVDQNGDRPLLLRFWSRAPVDLNSDNRPRSSPSLSTSGYRENSRSPTENLYKEISAQEVYKVLGAKQWKHIR